MGFENKAGIGVHNYYGARNTGGSVGKETGDNSVVRASINLTGAMLNGTFIPPFVVPKGALFTGYKLIVDEAFALGGTTPTVQIGAAGSVATNGVVLSKAELEAVGAKTPASEGAGTWATNSATGVTAAAKVAFALGGTTPTVAAGQGKATLIMEYIQKAKA